MSSNTCNNDTAEHEITFNCNKTIGVLYLVPKTIVKWDKNYFSQCWGKK